MFLGGSKFPSNVLDKMSYIKKSKYSRQNKTFHGSNSTGEIMFKKLEIIKTRRKGIYLYRFHGSKAFEQIKTKFVNIQTF